MVDSDGRLVNVKLYNLHNALSENFGAETLESTQLASLPVRSSQHTDIEHSLEWQFPNTVPP